MSDYTETTRGPGRPPWVLPLIVAIVAVAAVVIALIVTNDSSSDSSTDATVVPAATPAPTAPGADANADDDATPEDVACPEFTNKEEIPLMLCDSGELVRSIQGGLTTAGFPVEADGFYGPATQQAVTEFQQSQGLEADGIYGPDTEAALEAVAGGS